MAKFRITHEDIEIRDSWGADSDDIVAVRVNGCYVERQSKSGEWFTTYNHGKPLDRIIRTENGTIMAVTADGKVVNANVNLRCDPNNRPSVREIEINETKMPADTKKSKKESSGKSSVGKSALKLLGKGLWGATKFVVSVGINEEMKKNKQ